MDSLLIEKIKRLAIVALVSDDYLMEQLVLKGGNAIDLVYQISGRASMDLDFSMPTEFKEDDLDGIKSTIESLLVRTYREEGLVPFDIRISQKPEKIGNIDEMEFWGGYAVEFKIIPMSLYERYSKSIVDLRKQSTVIGPSDRKILRIEISKFECCAGKEAKEIDGYTVYVYSTDMIVIEKIRAICQQHPQYRAIVKSHAPSARARDFFDIYTITQTFPIDFSKKGTKELLKASFESKRVPLSLIRKVASQREFHSKDYPSLRDTVKKGVDLRPFDHYFDYVLNLLNSIDI